MHDSMTMADVGDIVNVSGSRIATPLAPPRPGRTPITTPRTMPTSISPKFIGVRMTPNPCRSALSSTIGSKLSVAEEAQRVERALVERHLEPDLEHQEEDRDDDHRQHAALHGRILAQDD